MLIFCVFHGIQTMRWVTPWTWDISREVEQLYDCRKLVAGQCVSLQRQVDAINTGYINETFTLEQQPPYYKCCSKSYMKKGGHESLILTQYEVILQYFGEVYNCQNALGSSANNALVIFVQSPMEKIFLPDVTFIWVYIYRYKFYIVGSKKYFVLIQEHVRLKRPVHFFINPAGHSILPWDVITINGFPSRMMYRGKFKTLKENDLSVEFPMPVTEIITEFTDARIHLLYCNANWNLMLIYLVL